MEQSAPRRTVVLGIDPGRHTGLYSVSIPASDRALSVTDFCREAHWLGNATINLSERAQAPKVERWREMYERISDAIRGAVPDLMVLEYPADGMPGWSGPGKSQRGTDFTMGMFFGFAAIGAGEYAKNIGGLASCHIALCPVTSSKAKGRVGWMPKVTTVKGNRRVTHTQDRKTTLRQCHQLAAATMKNARVASLGSPAQYPENVGFYVDQLSDHELMALGVLTWYVTNKNPAQWGE